MNKFWLSLSHKFLFAWIATSALTLILLGVVFSYLINQQNQISAQQTLSSSFSQIRAFFFLRSHTIESLVSGLANDVNIFNITSLLNNYQQKENYQPLLFDEEKKNLSTLLSRQKTYGNNMFLAVYKGDGELVSYVQRDQVGTQQSGYLSYEDGEAHIHLHSDDPIDDPDSLEIQAPSISSIMAPATLPERESSHYQALNGHLIQVFIAPITDNLKQNVIGSVVAVDHIGEFYEANAFQLIKQPTSLLLPGEAHDYGPLVDGNMAAEPTPELMEDDNNFNFFSNDNLFVGSSGIRMADGRQAIIVTSMDKAGFDAGINTLQKSIFLTIVLVALCVFPLGAYFIRRNLKNPIHALMEGVATLRHEAKFGVIRLNSHDEFGLLANAFNEMSWTISQREGDLKNSRDQIRLIADNLPILITYIDSDYRYKFANKTCADWYQTPIEEIIGKTISEIHQEQFAVFQPNLEDAKKGENIIFETRAKYPDGKIRDIRGGLIPDLDENQNVRGLFAFSEDITEAKATEEKYRQSQKMEAIGQLAGGIAHDFNNLLTIVSGNLKLISQLCENKNMNLDLKEAIEDSISAANDGATLTSELLSFSRKTPLKNEIISSTEALQGSVRLASRLLPENIKFNLNMSSLMQDHNLINIDRSQFDNSMMNLMINAGDAMPNGGEITITYLPNIPNAQVPDPDQGEEYIAISVHDTGTGMSDDVLAHAAEPFFTTKPTGRGTGLGLSSVYGFVTQSNGRIQIQSHAGQGTTVCLFFPKVIAGKGGAAITKDIFAADPSLPLTKNKSILIVEDEGGVKRLLQRHFKGRGFTVHAANNADEALAFLQNNAPDIMLTDIMMPGSMKGTQLALKARALYPSIIVILLTGYSEEGVLTPETRVFPLIRKPYDVEDIEARIMSELAGTIH